MNLETFKPQAAASCKGRENSSRPLKKKVIARTQAIVIQRVRSETTGINGKRLQEILQVSLHSVGPLSTACETSGEGKSWTPPHRLVVVTPQRFPINGIVNLVDQTTPRCGIYFWKWKHSHVAFFCWVMTVGIQNHYGPVLEPDCWVTMMKGYP